jgi:hypothetical protein
MNFGGGNQTLYGGNYGAANPANLGQVVPVGFGNIWDGVDRDGVSDPASYVKGRNYGIALGAGAVGLLWAGAAFLYMRSKR